MARSNNNLNAVLKDTADAIRAKKNTSEPIVPRDFADEIESIQSGGGDDYVNLLADNLQNVVVPSIFGQGEHELRPGAFAYAYDLKKIDFNNEDEVPPMACYSCNRLIEAKGNEVEFIRNNAFTSCLKLASISFPKVEIVDAGAFSMPIISTAGLSFTGVFNPYMPNLEVISNYGFYGVKVSDAALSFPKLFEIGQYGFMTYSITNATLYAPNLVSIGSWGMAQSSLASTNGFGFSALDLPNLQDADYHCFKNQRALKEINIPYCHFVGGGSQSHFTDCRELVSVSNKWGYNGTFMSCYKLKDIDFIIRNVYDGFAYCSSLESVSYGGSSAIQYRSAFYGCSKLERIDVLGISIPLSYKDCFYNTPMSNSTYTGNWGSIYVPSSRVAWYKASTNWITYSDRITALPSEYDTRFVYAGEFSSSTITAIPSEKFNVEEILAYGFYQANSIAGALSFPNCERIDAYAFYASTSCSTITGLSFPSCKVIDNGVFQQRRFDFSVVEFPECVRLGIFAFSGCRFLLTGNNSSVYFNFPKLKYLDGWSTFTLYYGASSYYTPWMHFSFPELEVMRTSSQFAWSVKSLYAPKLKYCIGSQSYATFSGFRTNLWCDSLDLPELRLIEGDIMTAISSPLSQISLPKCYKIAGMISTARSLTSLYAPNLLVLGGLYDLPLLSGELDFSKLETIDTIYGVGVEKVKLLKPSTMVSFYSCSKLKKVYLGSLDQFTGNAFANCPLLEAVYFEHKHVVDLGQAFGNTSCSIYVPAELLSEYQASPQWSNVSNNFVGLTDEQFQAVLSNW